MSKQKEKKFHWRVFLVAWVGLFLLGLAVYTVILRDFANVQLSNVEHLIVEIAINMVNPVRYLSYMIGIEIDPVLEWILVISLYSLIIERAYYMYRKQKMKRQAGGLGE